MQDSVPYRRNDQSLLISEVEFTQESFHGRMALNLLDDIITNAESFIVQTIAGPMVYVRVISS